MTCPSSHRHAASTTCYKHHGCRCSECVNEMRFRWNDAYAAAHGHKAEPLPCGTTAAAKRHYRRGERVCKSCRQAESRAWQDRKHTRTPIVLDFTTGPAIV